MTMNSPAPSPSSSAFLLLFLLALPSLASARNALPSGLLRAPPFPVAAASASSSAFVPLPRRRSTAAFVDDRGTKGGTRLLRRRIGLLRGGGGASSIASASAMASSKGGDDDGGVGARGDARDDAEAYHEAISAAVDLSDVHVRNGVVTATRSVRDVDANVRRRFLYRIALPAEEGSRPPFSSPPAELPAKIKARVPSPSGNKLAVLIEEEIDGKKRQAFEIWTDGGHRLSNRIVLSSEAHGQVCADFAWFGGVSWNPDETALVYSAEVDRPKTKSFFATEEKGDDGKAIVGGQHALGEGKIEDWGEKYGATALLGLFCLNVATGNVGAVANVPGSSKENEEGCEGGHVLGQPAFDPSGKVVLYVAWDAGGGGEMPRRLGAIYCFHRPCKLCSSNVEGLLDRLARTGAGGETDGDGEGAVPSKEGEAQEGAPPFACLTPDDRLARSPRFSKPRDGVATLAYLCNTQGFDTHGGCMALRTSQWDATNGRIVEGSTKVVVDVVRLPGGRGDGTVDTEEVADTKFPGLFLNQLSTECFSPDGKYIVATTEWGSIHKVIQIKLDDGIVAPVDFDLASDGGCREKASQQFLGFAAGGGAVVAQSEANRPTILGYLAPSFLAGHGRRQTRRSTVLADMPPMASTSLAPLESGSSLETSGGIDYRISNVHPEHGKVKVPVGTILLTPKNTGDKPPPLIVVPHGGPHTCMSTSYVPSYAFLCRRGYAVLHVNFRGSTGFGQDALESLAGTAGDQDVGDVVAATRAAIEKGEADPERVGICGGSHGGFLAAHCIGQHPDLFKASVMRNPCTNIASMVTATDIPDWCYVETLGPGSYDFTDFRAPSRSELRKMWDQSPIAHLSGATAPTMIALGMKDRRVPPSQGLEYYHALRAKGVPTKLLVYDDCDHAIDVVASEADFWINAKRWFDRHL